MKNWFPRIEKALLLSLALLVGMPMTGMAQNKKSAKMTPHTRMVMGGRDGKIDFEKGRAEMQRVRKQQKKRANQTIGNIPLMFAGDLQERTSVPMAAPVRLKGQDYVECWISLTNQDYHELENLGVKILARFQGKVIANIPVCAMAQVASQKNVTKVSVAKTLDKKTYRSRVMTNVDDVLTLSADAISAGLSQAYDGTGVVLGIIDTGIDFGHSMLSGSRLKKKYVYDEDADGAALQRNSDNYEIDHTSEYVYIHYQLFPRRQYTDGNVVIAGRWTTEQPGQYVMTYDEETHSYQATVLQKLGYYNYMLQLQDFDGTTHTLPEEGSFFQTENRYQAYVYYCGTGERSWRLLGFQEIVYWPK